MDLTSLLFVPGVVGGLVVALLMLVAHRRRSSGIPRDAFANRVDAGRTDVINISAIRVAGVGGLGLVAMALALAWSIPRIGQSLALGAVLGVALAVVLILRRRSAGPMPTSGRRIGANTTLSIDQPASPTDASAADSTEPKIGQSRLSAERARHVIAGALIFASVGVMAQDQRVWVNVLIDGKAVMAFVPAPDRASMNQSGVGSSEVRKAGAKTKDGLSIHAFEIRGWREGEGYRVLVFAIVQTDDRASRAPGYDGVGLKQVEFDSLLIRAGEEQIISKMKGTGVTPWLLRAGKQER